MDWNKLLNNNRLRQTTRKSREDARNDFESDFGRIIFSPAIRRMHDKTQVFPLTSDDNIHSRLTHSLEVMSVGYTLGVNFCESKIIKEKIQKDTYQLFREIPIIIKNCCLVHDIGNPPFGHFGEAIIQNYFSDYFKDENNINKINLNEEEICDFTEFDGNAQGLRILSKLQFLNDTFGLNLTYATLGAYIKYPNYGKIDEDKLEKHKRGVFQSEKAIFDTIVDECGLEKDGDVIRHPLCYLMEAADSICYLTMDMEDGYNKKIYDIHFIYNQLKTIPSIAQGIEAIYNDPEEKYRNDTTKIVNFRIHIIQTLVNIATKNFENNLQRIENGNYKHELIEDDESGLVKKLKFIQKIIFSNREIVSLEVTGHSVITGLLNYYINFVFHEKRQYRKRAASLISGSIIKASIEENIEDIYNKRLEEFNSDEKRKDVVKYEELFENLKKRKELETNISQTTNKETRDDLTTKFYKLDESIRNVVNPELDDLNDYYKLRIIVDFITGMTDQYALNHFQKISGQKII